MSEDKAGDEIRPTMTVESPSITQEIVRVERRRRPRVAPKSVADAHAIVKAIGKRHIENDSTIKKWRFLERGVYLFGLVGAFLVYYLLDKMSEAISLPGLGF